ncbi:MAG: ATPase [Firmicutes bacterium]|nr:ATPase [Bacillota bacterium]
MENGRVKRVFPGGNTGIGFHSFFNYIAGPDIDQVYVIKGGPGTGKSTLMRKIADKVRGDGLNVELHHCASDNNSLDGLVVPALKVALIDGMKPHLHDPEFPGAVGELLNLGQYWNSEGIRVHAQKIMAAGAEGGRLFRSAYHYLGAARQVHANWEEKISGMQDWGWVNQESDQLCKDILGHQSVAARPGRQRHLFVSAFTPEGPISYAKTLTGAGSRIVTIRGQPGSGKSTLLTKIASAAEERGHLVEIYHSPLDPAKLQHVLIPELDVFLATSTELFPYASETEYPTINLDYGLDRDRMVSHRTEIETDRQTFLQLLNTAIGLIKRARETHLEVEGFYVENMDFAALDSLRERLLSHIIQRANT